MEKEKIDERIQTQVFQEGFKLQQPAIDWPRREHTLPIFAYDVNEEATKQYCVGGYYRFFDYYKSLTPKLRNHYELIRVDLPCKLYVDFEIDLISNTAGFEDGGVAWCVRFENDLRTFLYETYPDVANADTVHFLMLDCSTKERLSRHYIVKISDACFANNFHCGAFMRRFHRSLIVKYGQPHQNPYFIQPPHKHKNKNKKSHQLASGRICAIDYGVYTTNRLFRICASSKFGNDERTRSLWFGHELEWRRSDIENRKKLPPRLEFMLYLVQFFQQSPKHVLTSIEHDNSPAYSTSDLWLHLVDLLESAPDELVRRASTNNIAKRQRSVEVSPIKANNELFEEVVNYIKTQFDSCPTRNYSFTDGCITIPLGSRKCRLLGGEHSKNFIYVVVWLDSGDWYQKCHSQSHDSCAGKHTRSERLPEALAARCKDYLHRQHENDEILNLEKYLN